jgi:1-acyl-sn-glycerol-3-phosphate acyltransferase
VLERKERLCRVIKAFSRAALSLFYHIEIEGDKNFPRENAFILLPKHQCWQDIPIIALATPRPLYYIAKHELFEDRFAGWFFRSLGGIPLNREQPLKSRASIRAMIEFLENGEGVVVFPEGTYYKNQMGPGKTGMVRLLVSRLSFPLIPVGVKYSRREFRILVRVKFGKPIYPHGRAAPNAILDRVMKEIALLSGLR